MRTHALSEKAGNALVKADKAKMVKEPDQWRVDVKPFRKDAEKGEKNQAQKSLRDHSKSFEKHEKIDGTEIRSGRICYRKRHFRKHFAKWEDGDSEDADAKFDELHNEQGTSNDESEEMVSVPNPKKRIDEVKTRQTRTGVNIIRTRGPNIRLSKKLIKFLKNKIKLKLNVQICKLKAQPVCNI
jgi:hypothetical protein